MVNSLLVCPIIKTCKHTKKNTHTHTHKNEILIDQVTYNDHILYVITQEKPPLQKNSIPLPLSEFQAVNTTNQCSVLESAETTTLQFTNRSSCDM